MKRILSAILALALILCAAACFAEDAAEGTGAAGEWYARELGIVITLTLNGDGTYTIRSTGESEPSAAGTWAEDDGFISLDGGENGVLNDQGNILVLEPEGTLFVREKPEAYVPAEVIPDAAPGDFDGYWTSVFTEVNGEPVDAGAVGETTDLYFEGTKAALGGYLFGDVIAEMTAADGALTFGDENGMITVQLQEDDFLRLTVSVGENSLVIWLLRASTGEE